MSRAFGNFSGAFLCKTYVIRFVLKDFEFKLGWKEKIIGGRKDSVGELRIIIYYNYFEIKSEFYAQSLMKKKEKRISPRWKRTVKNGYAEKHA